MAQAPAFHEPDLSGAPDRDPKLGGEKGRTDANVWRPKDGHSPDARPPALAKKKKGLGFYLALAVAFAVTAGAYVHLKSQSLPPGKAKTVVPVPPGASLPGPLESRIPEPARQSDRAAIGANVAVLPPTKEAVDAAAPSTSQQVAPTAPASAVPTDRVQNTSDIKAIEARLDDLTRQFGTMADEIKTLIAGHAQSKEQLAQLTARSTPAPVAAAARPTPPTPPRQYFARATTPKPVATVNASGRSTSVVSVDVWNGTPSVAIAEGDGIRFMSLGDVTAQGMTVKRADPVAQQVTFSMPSGDEVTARVDAPK